MIRVSAASVIVIAYLMICSNFAEAGKFADSQATSSIHAAKLDANEVSMYVSNNGSFARKEGDSLGRYNGLYYPADLDTPLVYSAGIWLTAMVNGSLRVAMAEYGTEFAPGPFGGEHVADSSVFRVYKIASADTLNPSDDWNSWPTQWGALVDDDGKPLLTGEQSLFAVFNDGDSTRHKLRGGATRPLGADIRLYAHEYARSGLLDQIVWMKWVIINRSPDDWHDLIIGVWADPDIGVASDDMGGSDSSRSLVYCYSLESDGALPAGFAPAVGLRMLSSPSLAESGRASSSANILINYSRSQNAKMTRDISLGLDTDGAEYADPTTGYATRYRFGGDPRSGRGWIDTFGKADRAIIVSSGPADVMSGDTCVLVAAILVASGESNAEAIDRLFGLADAAQDFYLYGFGGVAVADDQRPGLIRSVKFSPAEQTWMQGVDWGGSAMDGGIGWAGELWGSSVPFEACTDVKIEFHPGAGQKAYRLSDAGGSFAYRDYVSVPFDCIRMADSNRLSVLFVDNNADGVWSTRRDSSEQADILLVTTSDYSDEPIYKYTHISLPNDALIVDLMYAVSLRLRPLYQRTNIREGQTLDIIVAAESELPEDSGIEYPDVPVGLTRSRFVSICNRYGSAKKLSISSTDPDRFRPLIRTMDIAEGDTARFEIVYEPTDTRRDSASLRIGITDFNMPGIALPLVGNAVAWPLAGDFIPNGTLDIYDVTSFIRYLYMPAFTAPVGVRIDLDGSGEVDLVDAVVLINRIFLGL